MADRALEGVALLVAAHGTSAADLHALGRVGEALLASGERWRIRRLAAGAGERYPADRGTLKRHVHELVREPARVAIVVAIGSIAEIGGEPALVTGSNHRAYPDVTTLGLGWLRERLTEARARELVLVLAARPAEAPAARGDADRWLAALAPTADVRLVAIDALALGSRSGLVEALHRGLGGDALDSRTGTVTTRSLGEHLARTQPAATFLGLAPRAPATAASEVRAPGDLTGQVLPGRFRLDARVAGGTFGAVYRARQLAVERDVAVKVLHPGIGAGSADGRLFVSEIQAVGRIDHANVVRIYQADTTRDGRLFYAMELLAGRDLQACVADGPLAPARAVGLVQQLLAGLAAAHAAGLVHADVKPANAIVVPRAGGERLVLVDFGLARLRAGDHPAESAGGTPAYMAPEQLRDGRVDARSDLFSAALVLVTLLTGWRRPDVKTLVPPLADLPLPDARLRAVLARALALDPAERHASAAELAAALADEITAVTAAPPPAPRPFRRFAPYTEADRGKLHGRDADTSALVEQVLYGRAIAYTAPSGTGKTSLLRAGLAPRIEQLGGRVVYLRCRGEGDTDALLALLAADAAAEPAPPTLAAALAATPGGKLVLVLDQVEASLPAAAVARAALTAAAGDADLAVVLGIREDALARVIAAVQDLEPALPILRLPPLPLAGAHTAIVAPLAEARLAIEPALLDALLEDLRAAGAALAPEMGWGAAPAVYPPHLQLAGSVLVDALAPGEVTLTLARYRELGGFDAIVGEHLERVLDVELSGERTAIARDLLVALVTTAHERAMRPEVELVDIVAAKHARGEIAAVLDILRARGLIVRTGTRASEPGFELAHDSLVARVQAWLERKDLARRRAIELVRYHLRRSTPAEPSLLGRRELRELRAHAGAVRELDGEWARRPGEAWTPSRLVTRSSQVLRRRALMLGGGLLVAFAVASGSLYARRAAEAREAAKQRLQLLDLGRVVIQVEGFDWDLTPFPGHAVPVGPRALRWTLHVPDRDDPDQPGAPYDAEHVVVGAHDAAGDHVEARGGRAFLVVDQRGADASEPCAPSIIPIAALPGYMARATETVIRVRVPTCAATRADTIAIPAGAFIYGGPGEPLSVDALTDAATIVETRMTLPAFRIDRTEVTNAAFAQFAELTALTGIANPVYPAVTTTALSGDPDHPVAALSWTDARAYCEFMGKDLPSTQEWVRALRGGETLPDGSRNPVPRRNFPWGRDERPEAAFLHGSAITGSAAVLANAEDRSPEGVLDLAGNLMEWTRSHAPRLPATAIIRGGNMGFVDPAGLRDAMAIENSLLMNIHELSVGMRCAGPAR